MKRISCVILTLFFLCGCTVQTPKNSANAMCAKEVFQVNAPYFDPQLITETMSAEELVGQLFLARCPSDETAIADIGSYNLGGFILFGRDFEDQSSASVRSTIQSYQSSASIPLLIAVDEEGGTVCRVSSQALLRNERFASIRSLYSDGGIELLSDTEAEKCQLLTELGINVNMAPVCDITTNPDAFMYSRSLGLEPQQTGSCIAEIVGIMNSYQIGSVLKHFPGYGNNTDTHTGIAVDTRALAQLESEDLIPFRYGINAGCGAVLVSHTMVTCLDDQLPASLSPAVIRYLREEMEFDGVIMTDDLVMDAISDRYGTGEAAVLAVLAGNDLLCSSEYQEQYAAVLEAVKSGRISAEQLYLAVCRVLNWKYDLGLLPANA